MTPDTRRLEELGLNSSAPPGQLLHDGWLLRLLPGKAKRARSVNAVYPSRLPLQSKIDYCERLYGGAGLPTLFRITPFSEPGTLEDALEARGYGRFDETSVQSAAIDIAMLEGGAADSLPLPAWVEAIGDLRDSPAGHRAAHLVRLQAMPLTLDAVVLHDAGRVVATGLTVVEDDCAGLFDIVTAGSARRRGHGRQVVAALLRSAHALGARHAYLQVESGNESARHLYARFGFAERYRYWYRGRPGEQR